MGLTRGTHRKTGTVYKFWELRGRGYEILVFKNIQFADINYVERSQIRVQFYKHCD
jgi:hypothetical protein